MFLFFFKVLNELEDTKVKIKVPSVPYLPLCLLGIQKPIHACLLKCALVYACIFPNFSQ